LVEEAALTEAGTLEQNEVIAALDHAKIPGGPGGPAEMVPGRHYVRMNMFIAGRTPAYSRSSRTSGSSTRKERLVGDVLEAHAVSA
jgi:branched-chain amino acid transport system substrate-binding protein